MVWLRESIWSDFSLRRQSSLLVFYVRELFLAYSLNIYSLYFYIFLLSVSSSSASLSYFLTCLLKLPLSSDTMNQYCFIFRSPNKSFYFCWLNCCARSPTLPTSTSMLAITNYILEHLSEMLLIDFCCCFSIPEISCISCPLGPRGEGPKLKKAYGEKGYS